LTKDKSPEIFRPRSRTKKTPGEAPKILLVFVTLRVASWKNFLLKTIAQKDNQYGNDLEGRDARNHHRLQ
jgi:hypothetical protein